MRNRSFCGTPSHTAGCPTAGRPPRNSRGDSRHPAGTTVLVSLEEIRPGPSVGGVRRHIDGNVPHDGDAFARCIFMQRPPLPVKLILQEGPELQFLAVAGTEPGQRRRVPQPQFPGPLLPIGHAVFFLDGHVQAVVGQPIGRKELEPIPVVGVRGLIPRQRTALEEVGIGFAQHREPPLIQDTVVHMGGIAAPLGKGVVLAFEQTVPGQQIQVQKIGVARKRRTALVGAVGIAGGSHRQDLPNRLPARARKSTKRRAGAPRLPMP